jgi:phage shock protein A
MAYIKAHGAVYMSVEDAEARIAELEEGNRQYGASDGRVTEINTIREALEAQARLDQAIANSRSRYQQTPALSGHMAEQVHEAERRIAYLERNKDADDGQWRYLKTQDDAGRISVRREYKTELGFLKAYVREARRGRDILIAE